MNDDKPYLRTPKPKRKRSAKHKRTKPLEKDLRRHIAEKIDKREKWSD